MMQNYVDSGFITLTDPANTIYAFHFGPGFMYPSDLPYCGWHYYYTIFDHGEPVTVIVVFTLHDNINCRSPFPPVGYYFKFDVNIYHGVWTAFRVHCSMNYVKRFLILDQMLGMMKCNKAITQVTLRMEIYAIGHLETHLSPTRSTVLEDKMQMYTYRNQKVPAIRTAPTF